MTEFVRTADENFTDLPGFVFTPNYHLWQDLRMHYLDEGPKDGPVMLLMHGMPTWSYLYRDVIPVLVDAGYRCIAPDHMGSVDPTSQRICIGTRLRGIQKY